MRMAGEESPTEKAEMVGKCSWSFNIMVSMYECTIGVYEGEISIFSLPEGYTFWLCSTNNSKYRLRCTAVSAWAVPY
jgi:hypothetical protein